MAIVLDGTTGIVVSGNTNSFSGVYVGEGNGALDTNTAVGRLVLSFNSTGAANSGYGQNSLALNTTGSYNSGFGRNTLQASSTGSYNTAVGESALYSNSTASYHTAVGYQAGYTLSTGQQNTLIGALAGTLVTGGDNTFIGTSCGSAMTTGSKNTIIGRYNGNLGGLDIRTSNNYIVLSDGDGNPRALVDNSGKFLIGKTVSNITTPGWGFAASGSGDCVFTQVGTNEIFVWNNTVTNGTPIIDFRTNSISKGNINWNNTSTTYATVSDYRLKNTIAPMTGALAKVALLKPVTYKWNVDGSDGQGFIAHELQAVCPSAVTGAKDAVDADGNPKHQGIDTSFLVATLTAAIQEQQAIITQLQADVAALKA